jgi:hypothetical protein
MRHARAYSERQPWLWRRLLCAYCLFASDPPMPFAGDTSVALQKTPAVAEATPSELAVNAGPRRQASALPSCKGDNDCVRMLGLDQRPEAWLAHRTPVGH